MLTINAVKILIITSFIMFIIRKYITRYYDNNCVVKYEYRNNNTMYLYITFHFCNSNIIESFYLKS